MIVMRLQAHLLNMMLMLLPTFGFLSDKLLAFVLFVVAAAQAQHKLLEPENRVLRKLRDREDLGNWATGQLGMRKVERKKVKESEISSSYLSYSSL